MTVRLSTAFRNKMTGDDGGRLALANCILAFFVGAQPASADNPPQGQRILEFTKAGGVYTAPVGPQWLIPLTGAAGSINTIKFGGASGWDILGAPVNFATDLPTTAANVAAQINAFIGNVGFTASSNGANVSVIGPRAVGAALNSMTLLASVTTMTATLAGDSTPSGSGGVAGVAAVNGCNFQLPVGGVLTKETTAWQGVAGANRAGTAISGFSSGNLAAGWLRIYCDPSDDDSQSTNFARVDMSVGTSGTDMIANPSASVAFGSTQPINTFSIALPSGE
jgi:hypothetical protein